MPTHVHVLAEQVDGHRLDHVVHSWKSFTANRVNEAMGRSGRLWRREYFDRFMRTDEQLASAIAYIENNPVEAKLVNRVIDWPYSSARFRA
jgi:REP element-mobilizing transposase RayT